ncbi:MAG: coenzyme F420-0:L-glutamate ligase [Pseudomonadales bacterium]|jgi:coenzyme F420-0:L-glutamate ligase/coenzyme F420-1:gamma-L-glutamate ligase|nr:coenzyme F420-0:L-glutamate ligase [Pseudomonadales bacterium]MDP7594662.1 coenzyme F420-0:L-glutamate ligase [Pseudomonadales bacterium]HJN49744.1 coenzyme F420-0:L-glutamate ligase [Pseudomonadales bacterium]|tara:strand:+ start:9301 stop:10074 length:774 start_codon:yes stop_codon:yes gene_type:complete
MKLSLSAVAGIPMVQPGDDLVELMGDAIIQQGDQLRDDDVLVIAQKIISKAENRYVDLADVEPSDEAIQLALEVDKDPRHVQVILSESNEVVRKRLGVLIVEHKLGFVHANAGVDQSNIEHDEQHQMVLLLPVDPDLSARRIRAGIKQKYGVTVAVIINDSLGRAWRNGSLGLAIGVAGFTALEDYIGGLDLFGRELVVTQVGAADELSAGASLVMGQTDEKTPVVLVRGYRPAEPEEEQLRGVKPLLRDKLADLFR